MDVNNIGRPQVPIFGGSVGKVNVASLVTDNVGATWPKGKAVATIARYHIISYNRRCVKANIVSTEVALSVLLAMKSTNEPF